MPNRQFWPKSTQAYISWSALGHSRQFIFIPYFLLIERYSKFLLKCCRCFQFRLKFISFEIILQRHIPPFPWLLFRHSRSLDFQVEGTRDCVSCLFASLLVYVLELFIYWTLLLLNIFSGRQKLYDSKKQDDLSLQKSLVWFKLMVAVFTPILP